MTFTLTLSWISGVVMFLMVYDTDFFFLQPYFVCVLRKMTTLKKKKKNDHKFSFPIYLSCKIHILRELRGPLGLGGMVDTGLAWGKVNGDMQQ